MKRVEVLKTYKIFIGGKFPRTESGRYYPLSNKAGDLLANICLSSRKDIKMAVVAARKAQPNWWSRSAFNRSQIIYRIAEMMESRKALLIEEIHRSGLSKKDAEVEVNQAIDNVVYYAGWCDKYSQVFSAVNPVSSPHFNFTSPEPMGVITVIPSEKSALIGLVNALLPAIVGGNTVVLLADEKYPLVAIAMAEIINDSDVPAGVVNILTGKKAELIGHLSSHMDVNAITYYGDNSQEIETINEHAIENLKRVFVYGDDLVDVNPYFISDLQEFKTTWHPIEVISPSGSSY